MENIYANSYDHDVKAVVLFAGTDDTLDMGFMRLYIDKARTIAVSAEEMERLFFTGMLIVELNEVDYFRPYECKRTASAFMVMLGEETYVSAGEMGK